MKHYTNRLIAFAAALLLCFATPAFARKINVRGIVTNDKGEPLQGVAVYDVETDLLIASTNDEGKFIAVVDDAGSLLFSILGMEDLTVPVEGRLTLDVQLIASAIVLDEVTVRAKAKIKDVVPEPTDIEIRGNYAFIKTRIKVPHRLFDSSCRLIIQPALYNVSAKKMWYMQPLLYDGWRYHITQERMYDWDIDRDPLARFATAQVSREGSLDIIEWRDSVYLEDPNHDFHCDMLMAMEDYNNVFYRDTTTIARGIVNPLRFFQYSLLGTEVTDSAYFPDPEMQMRDTKGNIDLLFRVNSSSLDLSLGNNRAEMDALLAQLHRVENDPNSALVSLTISATSSPEGNYIHNATLAKQRTQSAVDIVAANLSATTRRYANLDSEATVASWESLVDMLRADGRDHEADDIAAIIEEFPRSIDAQYARIKRLSYYEPLIRLKYLPMMRKVSYQFVTSQYRYLTDDEILELYHTNPSSLSRNEFFRLYRDVARTDAEREEYMRKALEVHPKFVVAATDLAAMMLAKGEPDYDILAPFIVPGAKNIPEEARLNQVAACLSAHKYLEADSIISTLPDDDERFHKARMYVDVFNGRYENALQEVAAESPVNEVVLLLCLKANDQAWIRAQRLGDTAEEEYIKAIAAYRVDEYLAAVAHFDKALELKPELREVARIDGDLIELLKEKEEMEAEEAAQNENNE